MSNELIDSLLDEFKYRHELFWKIVFRFSSAIIILYTIPFLKVEGERSIDEIVLGFPFVGVVVSLAGIALLLLEYRILSFVEEKYNECKEQLAHGYSNIHAMNHKYIGYLAIVVWGLFFSSLGVAEFVYLGGYVTQ